MNIKIYLEDALTEELNECTASSGYSRNDIIREAIKEYIAKHKRKAWTDCILQYQGIADAVSFELHRKDLLPPCESSL